MTHPGHGWVPWAQPRLWIWVRVKDWIRSRRVITPGDALGMEQRRVAKEEKEMKIILT